MHRSPSQLPVRREYNIVLRTELARKEIRDDPNRVAEMAAYMTHAKLQPLHSALLLQNAMPLFFKLQNFATCAILCRRLLDLNLPQNAQYEKVGCPAWVWDLGLRTKGERCAW